MDGQAREDTAEAEDGFDAAVSALIMAEHADSLAQLSRPGHPHLRREGLIWWPGWDAVDWEEDAIRGGTQAHAEARQAVGAERGWNFDRALGSAVDLHGDQVRKGGEEVPYMGHLLGVCSLALEAGGCKEQAIAALLHDAVEDRGGRETLEAIRRRPARRLRR